MLAPIARSLGAGQTRLRSAISHRPVLLAAAIFVFIGLVQFPGVVRGGVIAPTDLLVQYPPWSLSGGPYAEARNTLRSDIIDSYIPAQTYFGEQVRDGNLPLWNDRGKQGAPFFQFNGYGLAFPSSLFFVALPPELAQTLTVFGRFVLLGLSMYTLLRALGLRPESAVVGGVAYQFQGFNVAWLFWTHTVVASVAPLLIAAIWYQARHPGPRGVLATSGATYLVVAAGFPSVAGYFLVLATAWAVGITATLWLENRASARLWLWPAVGIGLAGALGVGLLAFQLIPTLEALGELSVLDRRSSSSAAQLPLAGLKLLVLPLQYGSSVFNEYTGPFNSVESAGYIGWATGALAVVGGATGLVRRDWKALFFAGTGLAALLVVYGVTPLSEVLAHIPPFRDNVNTRLLSIVGFSTAVLAGFGAQHVCVRPMFGRQAVPYVVFLALGTGAACLAWQARWFVDHHEQVGEAIAAYPSLPVAVVRHLWVAAMTPIWLGIVIVAVLIISGTLTPRAGIAGLAALMVLDGLIFSFRQNAVVDASTFYPTTPGLAYLQEHMQPQDRVIGFDDMLFPFTTAPMYGLATPTTHSFYSPIHTRLIAALLGNAFRSPTAITPRLGDARFRLGAFPLLGARYLAAPPAATDSLAAVADLVYRGDDMVIGVDTRVAPAYLVGNVTAVATGDALFEKLLDRNFSASRVAIITAADARVTRRANGEVVLVEYEAEKQVYRTQSPDAAMLVTTNLVYPGWKVWVDGTEAPLITADGLFRAVEVPPGSHVVVYEFESATFRRGVLISVASLAALVGLILLSARSTRKAATREGTA